MNSKIAFLLVAVVGQAASGEIIGTDPWGFALFGTGGVGTSSSRMTGSINGVVGSAGDVYFGNFSTGASGYAVMSGGSVDLSGGSVYGNVFATGGTTSSGASIYGSLASGGTLKGQGGAITGGVFAPENVSSLSITGGYQQQALADTWDAASMVAYYQDLNAGLGSAAANIGYENQWGRLNVIAGSGLNIVDVSSEVLNEAWGVHISGPSDATIVLRVSGVHAVLDSISWIMEGGAQASNVLANYYEAQSLNLSGGHTVTFLAPDAQVQFSGDLQGGLIGEVITGGGSITGVSFTGDVSGASVPAPVTALPFLGAVAVLAARRRRG